MVPAIARRDDKLAHQATELRDLAKRLRRSESLAARRAEALTAARAELASTTAALERPSFHRSLADFRRTVVTLRGIDPEMRHPLRQLPVKLPNYRLAASHGIATPAVHAAWSSVGDIETSRLPDEFVLKSDRGAGGHGVLPLRRTSDGNFAVINTSRVLGLEGIKERLEATSSLGGPFFAEELLKDPTGGSIPVDIKVYSFYGEVGHILLRRPHEHGNLRRTFSKFVDAQGQDLGDSVVDARIDPGIPVPSSLDEIISISRHLSRAVGVPFVRVDLYETDRGIVIGELTRGPGGRQVYSDDHDSNLGSLLEASRWRLECDLMHGRPPGIIHGMRPAADLYPSGWSENHVTPVVHAECAEWCHQ